MRNFSLLAAVAIVACAHQSASVPEPIAAATPEATPETAPSAVPEAAAAPVIAAAPATVQPVVPAVAAIPAERRAVQSANAPKVVGPDSAAIQVPAGPRRRAKLAGAQGDRPLQPGDRRRGGIVRLRLRPDPGRPC